MEPQAAMNLPPTASTKATCSALARWVSPILNLRVSLVDRALFQGRVVNLGANATLNSRVATFLENIKI